MEDIEELRAKAIASMPSSVNPNPSSTAAAFSGGSYSGGTKCKTSKSREEGEVSSDEGAVVLSPGFVICSVRVVELDHSFSILLIFGWILILVIGLSTCSVTPTNSANMGDSMPSKLKNTVTNAAPSNNASMNFRRLLEQNYQKRCPKHLRTKRWPFKPLRNQALQWHAKESKNNFVISFSDDDSESASEERYSENDDKKMDDASIAHKSSTALTSLPTPTDLKGEKNGNKPMPKRQFANHETVSSSHSAFAGGSEPRALIENASLIYPQISTVKTSAIQELRHVQGSAMADKRLELLRNQITTQEIKLKVKNNLVPQMKATGFHSLEQEAQATGISKRTHGTASESEVNELSSKKLKYDKLSSVFDSDVPSKPDNEKTFCVDKFGTNHQLEDDSTVKSKDSISVLSAAIPHDAVLLESDDVAKNGRSEKFSKAELRNLHSNCPSSIMHIIKGNQHSTADALLPLETFSSYKKPSGFHVSRDNEANITGEGRTTFQSLMELEELHNKELEEAQEHRRKCELEERRALNAYRKAQESLVGATERCAFLYGKRELISAKFRTFVVEASNSIFPSNWLHQQVPNEDQFHEPVVSTSARRETATLNGAISTTHNLNMSADDDGMDLPSTNVVSKSGYAHEMALSLDSSRDFELEASLRSELVSRLGFRTSCKVNATNKIEIDAEKIACSIAEDPIPFSHEMLPNSVDQKNAKLEGIEKSQERSCLLTAPVVLKADVNVSANEELPSITELDTDNSYTINSDSRANMATFSLPSSALHLMCIYISIVFPGYHSDTRSIKENDCIASSEEDKAAEKSDFLGEVLQMKGLGLIGYSDLYGSPVEIDPFRPLCMFELRGKCNDDECVWQHMKTDAMQSDTHGTCLPNGKLNASRFSSSAVNVLPIPTYEIGSYVIKGDSHQSQSVLARSNLQYRQKGFCASFPMPFSIQRTLPLDAPCLQHGEEAVADDYSGNRLSFYNQNLDSTLPLKEQIEQQGSSDVEQLLEIALNEYDADLCEPNRKKALSLLAHAIESHPSSVALWVVYLHIYYGKEEALGDDDMFLYAVQHEKGSYELWLLYINSRPHCEDRMTAYDRALYAMCRIEFSEERQRFSPRILDIFLQMMDFYRMSGNTLKVVSRLSASASAATLISLQDVCMCLVPRDRCLLLICCLHFLVYEKLPGSVVQQFELAKTLPFGLDWPPASLPPERESIAGEFTQFASDELSPLVSDDLECLHFLAANRAKCAAALQGGSAGLLGSFLRLYPSCAELVLLSARSLESRAGFSMFEEALRLWPDGSPGIQRLWNQYLEHSLRSDRPGSTEDLVQRWHRDFPKFELLNFHPAAGAEGDAAFGFLNLFLYHAFRKEGPEARRAVDRSLELAAPGDYLHFVKEHALFTTLNYGDGELRSLGSLLCRYLADHRADRLSSESMSRRFLTAIKKPRVWQLVDEILGPVSAAAPLLVNSVLEAQYGLPLLPTKFGDFKEAAVFVELVLELAPANYDFAMLVCRKFVVIESSGAAKFWACSLLVNSVLQAVPAAPEHKWIEAVGVLISLERSDLVVEFLKRAVAVYPFSVELWQSYADARATTGGDAGEIVISARERGIELSIIGNRL